MTGKQLKNSILQWAIQGKLVPQDPNDEPASVLLERIREEKARLIKEKKIKKDKNESIIYRGDDNSHYEKILATGEVKCIDDEIPFEIPENWAWCRISHLFAHTSGKQQSSNNTNGTPQKFITTSNLYWGHFVLNNVKVMNFTEEEIRTCSATKGDLLVCEGGAGYGRAAIWDKDYDICLQNHVHRLRPYILGLCEYVYHFIYLLKESNRLIAVGTAMPGLSANRLKSLLLPFPPFDEQQRIVKKIEELIPIVEHYNLAQTQLNTLNSEINNLLKKSILQEAIQGRLVPQIDSEEPATVLLEKIKAEKLRLVKEGKLKKKDLTDSTIFKGDDNKYYEKCDNTITCIDAEIPFEIPQSWSWCRLSTLMQILTGKKDANYGDEKGPYEFFTCSNTPLKSTTYSYDGDYLIMPGNGANIGQVIHYTGRFEAYQRTYLLHAYSLINLDYLKYHLMCNWKEYNQDKLYGSAIPYIKLGNLTSYLVALPPHVEQQRIVDKIEQSLASIMSR